MSGLDGAAQRFAGAEQVVLPDHILDARRPQSIREWTVVRGR